MHKEEVVNTRRRTDKSKILLSVSEIAMKN